MKRTFCMVTLATLVLLLSASGATGQGPEAGARRECAVEVRPARRRRPRAPGPVGAIWREMFAGEHSVGSHPRPRAGGGRGHSGNWRLVRAPRP